MEKYRLILICLSILCLLDISTSGVNAQSLSSDDQFKHPIRPTSSVSAQADLPGDVTPTFYTVFLRPVLSEKEEWPQFTTPGNVNIGLEVHSTTNRIVLHRSESTLIHSARVINSVGQEIPVVSQSYDKANEFHSFELASNLVPGGQYELSISFMSTVDTSSALNGLYLVRYTDENGDEKLAATTQFEASAARKAFPNFDEPKLKATFTISIARKAEFTSLSNSPLISTMADPDHEGWYIDSFNKTVKMSSYLVALLVSEFECTAADPEIFNGRPVQVCGPRHLMADDGGVMAANVSAHILRVWEEKFKYPYEQMKMDSVAIPDPYFGAGAMENWGLNIYRQNYLIYYPGRSMESDRRGIISVLAHELAHQWFGNLVTCKTWDGIWLNEGFASYVEKYFYEVTPEFDVARERLWGVQGALNYDVGVDMSLDKSADGGITYDKGSSVLRMVEGIMGQQLFLESLAEYLRRLEYDAAVQDDLFQVLTEFAHREGRIPLTTTMKVIMDTWSLQPGYPLLRVYVLSESSNRVVISQERLLPKSSQKEIDPSDLWEVPIYISSQNYADLSVSNRSVDVWLSGTSALNSIEIDTNSWSVFNSDGMGFYRVVYDDQLFGQIEAQLLKDHTVMSALTRSQVIDDYFEINRLGHVTADKPLRLTKYLLRETDHIVYTTLLEKLQSKTQIQAKLSLTESYINYWTPRVDALIDHIGIDNKGERGSMVLFRAKVLSWANSLGSTLVRQKASRLVEIWKLNPNSPVTLDYRQAIYCAAVADTEDSQFQYFLELYNSTANSSSVTAQERTRYFDALGCAQNPADVQTILELTLNAQFMNSAEVLRTYQKLISSKKTRDLAIAFLDERMKDLIDSVGFSSFVGSIVNSLRATVITEVERDVLIALIEKHELELVNSDTLINDINRSFNDNSKWMQQYGNDMLSWFSQNLEDTHKF